MSKTEFPDIGHLGKWSVSSYKYGFGAQCLQDNDPDTFWHSDGPQPHFITVQFPRRVAIQKLALHLSFDRDDSYTPSTVCVRAGTSLNEMQDVRMVSFEKPNSWIAFDISSEPTEDGDTCKPLHVFVVQVVIMGNHMNGKDTHVRGLRILGPVNEQIDDDDHFPFTSRAFKMYESIR
ncbi:anaphase-promoting complex, subunit 10 [Sistotremastrum suecicum HHB10207 ss-3]|uniref:Anaphase-promoting complex subunit 10 n=1 Tax=Sistotremastrum suecicum HHB10207 ss-3 TaxID=1314776 RepID=A0A166GZM7_9AGAM|nr:anaphase-promoting complex, subunit 10 [Sistotremastrum suecicum HHB10207 ss-3]